MVTLAEDDDRKFWVFTRQNCRHVIGVATDENYTRSKAFREMYGGVKAANQAIDRGVQAELVEAPEYHEKWYDKMLQGCTCPT